MDEKNDQVIEHRFRNYVEEGIFAVKRLFDEKLKCGMKGKFDLRTMKKKTPLLNDDFYDISTAKCIVDELSSNEELYDQLFENTMSQPSSVSHLRKSPFIHILRYIFVIHIRRWRKYFPNMFINVIENDVNGFVGNANTYVDDVVDYLGIKIPSNEHIDRLNHKNVAGYEMSGNMKDFIDSFFHPFNIILNEEMEVLKWWE